MPTKSFKFTMAEQMMPGGTVCSALCVSLTKDGVIVPGQSKNLTPAEEMTTTFSAPADSYVVTSQGLNASGNPFGPIKTLETTFAPDVPVLVPTSITAL